MKDYQRRIVQEKVDLDKKIKKLEKFLESPPISLAVVDVRLMNTQLQLMRAYSDVLTQREARFAQ